MKQALLLWLLWPFWAAADAGHDHGPATTPGAALPRFAATSELFELVGVLEGRQLTLYLDHADSNAPVPDATLEVELGGQKLTLQKHGEGELRAELPKAPEPGVIAVTATVQTAKESDLLAGELDLHAHEEAAPNPHRRWPLVAGAAALIVALTVALRFKRRRAAA